MEDFNYLLELPTVANEIFKFLSAKDLSSCANICKSWNVLASNIIRKRNQVIVVPKWKEISLNRLHGLWCKPDLVICVGHDDTLKNIDMMLEQIIFYENFSNESFHFRRLTHLFDDELRYGISQNNRLKNCLPTTCTIAHVNSILSIYYPLSLYSVLYFPLLIFIPIIAGVEIQPFLINNEITDSSRIKEIEPLFLSNAKNRLNSKIKCIILFQNAINGEWRQNIEAYAKTRISDYMCDETVIVEVRNRSYASMGISFSGESVQVDCVALSMKECCINSCFQALKHLGFNNKCGVALVVKKNISVDIMPVIRIWPTFFPSVVLASTLGKVSYNSLKINPQHQCDSCGQETNETASNNNHSIVITFVFFKDVNYEIFSD